MSVCLYVEVHHQHKSTTHNTTQEAERGLNERKGACSGKTLLNARCFLENLYFHTSCYVLVGKTRKLIRMKKVQSEKLYYPDNEHFLNARK